MKMKRIALALVLALGACDGHKSRDSGSAYKEPAEEGLASHDTAATTAPAAPGHGAGNGAAYDGNDGKDPGGLGGQRPVDNRKVIRTGRIALVVATYDDARAKVDEIVNAAGGYIDSTQVERRQDAVSDATLVIRVPASAFDGLLPKLRALGEITGESTNAADVTDQFVDTEARLASSQVLEKRLLELATARDGKIDQILEVERELARVRGDIEGYQGHLKQWSDQIAMSTLTISIATRRPEIASPPPEPPPTLGSRSSGAFHDSIASLRELGADALVDGIGLLPWLVLIIPGLLIARRLWRRMSRRMASWLPTATVIAQPIPAPMPQPPSQPPQPAAQPDAPDEPDDHHGAGL